ncbi:MAG: hypothetical protein AAGF85_11200 [Bacteroidota bacterium]
MQLLSDLSGAVALLSLIFLAVGLYKPWIMLWWEDTQNRRKILKVYGFATLFFYVLHLIFSRIEVLL